MRRASAAAPRLAAAAPIGLRSALYDGFFGPGTGSFFVFLFVRWLGYDFLNAAASAKLLNTMTNLGALLLLGLKGHVMWHYGLVMAVANVAGSVIGARVAHQARRGLRAQGVHRRGGRADPEDRLRRISALTPVLRAGQFRSGAADAAAGVASDGHATSLATRGLPIGAAALPAWMAAMSASLGYWSSSQ